MSSSVCASASFVAPASSQRHHGGRAGGSGFARPPSSSRAVTHRGVAVRTVASARMNNNRVGGGGGSASSTRTKAATAGASEVETTTPKPKPYTGYVAPEVTPEVIVKMPSPGALDDIDPREWVPQTADVSFRPLLLNVSQGYYVNLLRVRGAGVLSRHRHPGPVHGWVLKGRWNYLEHDWVAEEGSYVFEPPG